MYFADTLACHLIVVAVSFWGSTDGAKGDPVGVERMKVKERTCSLQDATALSSSRWKLKAGSLPSSGLPACLLTADRVVAGSRRGLLRGRPVAGRGWLFTLHPGMGNRGADLPFSGHCGGATPNRCGWIEWRGSGLGAAWQARTGDGRTAKDPLIPSSLDLLAAEVSGTTPDSTPWKAVTTPPITRQTMPVSI